MSRDEIGSCAKVRLICSGGKTPDILFES
jgi:hypothetical protein